MEVSMPGFTLGIVLALSLSIALPASVQAQALDERIVLLGAAPGDRTARLAIFVRSHADPSIVLTVPATASPEELAGAFLALHRMRAALRASGAGIGEGTILRADVPPPNRRTPLTPEERASYARYLSALAKAHRMDVAGVGSGRAVAVVMPNWPVSLP
jgi:hypothetical protein